MNSVENYIAQRTKEQQVLLTLLRTIILTHVFPIEEKISYTVPFFYHHGALCYLVPKGNSCYIAFVRGVELSKDVLPLEINQRKLIRSITFHSADDILKSEKQLRLLLLEAMTLNQVYAEQKRHRKGKRK